MTWSTRPFSIVSVAYQPSSGWTVFTQQAGDKIFYVSQADGNDTNDGLSPTPNPGGGGTGPVKTANKASTLPTVGHADWVLFKKGEVWTADTLSAPGIPGRSATQPLVWGSYGGTSPVSQPGGGTSGTRPLFRITPASGAFFFAQGGFSNCDFNAIVHVEIYAYTRDPNNASFSAADAHNDVNGINIISTGSLSYFLVEGCKITYCGGDAVHYSPNTNQTVPIPTTSQVVIRRNVMAYSYLSQVVGHSSGFGSAWVYKTVLYQNFLYQNGWNDVLTAFRSVSVNVGANTLTWTDAKPIYLQNGDSLAIGTTANGLTAHTNANQQYYTVTGLSGNTFSLTGVTLTGSNGTNTIAWADPGATEFNHSCYLTSFGIEGSASIGSCQGPADVQENIFAGDGQGTLFRPGVNPLKNNLFINNPYQFSWGMPHAGTYNGSNNVILTSTSVPFPQAPGQASNVDNSGSGYTTEDPNYHGDNHAVGVAVFDGDIIAHNQGAGAGGAGFGGISINSGYNLNPSITITNAIVVDWPNPKTDPNAGNVYTGSVFQSADTPINGGDRTVATYDTTIGGPGTVAHFVAGALAQSLDNWDIRYTANAVNTYIRAGFGR